MAGQLLMLEKGSMVDRWCVERRLGQGDFGAVYQVSDCHGKTFALKIESVVEEVQILKMEVFVLTALEKLKSRHFCKIEDGGRWGPFYYMVMSLVGKNLVDLREAQEGKHFSMGTALGIGIQAIEALQSLHSIGYLHRDIKPGNFAIGRPGVNDLRNIYILDFGMCLRYIDSNGAIRRPRATVGFRGTARYAPLSAYDSKELCRRDDLESWLYVQVELTTGSLPWKSINDLFEIADLKRQCRKESHMSMLLHGCAPELKEVLLGIDRLNYHDAPPYERFRELMRQSFVTTGAREHPYDWENAGAGVF